MTEQSRKLPLARDFDGAAERGAIVLSRYRIESLLGFGAAGAVYKGYALRGGRPVAIKIQHAENVEGRARFEREAMLLARIQHPHVVGVVDYGVLDDGAAVVVMEYVDGVDAKTFAGSMGGSLPWRLATLLAVGLLDGLDAAHEAGVLHRDVKPENVLIQRGDPPLVKLVDFGIARARAEGELPKLTGAGQILGSIAYMAPEQLAGDPIDQRMDIYSAGTVLFELLCAKLPFEGHGTRLAMLKIVSAGPESIPSVPGRERWPSALDRALLSMLRGDPDERPQSAFAAREALLATLHAW
jgi:serine/threonine protein kinase